MLPAAMPGICSPIADAAAGEVDAGLARARAQGKRLGRPSIPVAIEHKIRDRLKKGGTGIRKVAKAGHPSRAVDTTM